MLDLATIWAALIAFSVLAYVVLDGFDLGVGILFPYYPDRADRDLMTNSIAPVWDGNETWLVLGGGGLMAAFPTAYAAVMPALYVPIIVMLLGLIFRGVAFEFRWRTRPGSRRWDIAFWLGSTIAAFMQGIALGMIVQGGEVEGNSYAAGSWNWFTPFSVTTGFAVVVGYALLGATWLNLKTSGEIQQKACRIALRACFSLFTLIAAVSLWTPFIDRAYFDRWFGWPTAFFSALVPTLLMICAWVIWHGLRSGQHLAPFLAALSVFVLCFAGLGISFYPFILPGVLTIEAAAAPDASLGFLLVGALILVPIILIYTGYAYWVFRGKIDPAEGYH